jgi:hypothetical protein
LVAGFLILAGMFIYGPLPPPLDSAEQAEERERRRDERWYWKWSIVAGGASGMGALAAAFFAAGAYFTAREQANIAQEALVASIRPWISLDADIDRPIRFDKGGAHLFINWTLKNYGHTPAPYISLWAEIVPLETEETDRVERLRCHDPEQGRNHKLLTDSSLFPEESMTLLQSFDISRSSLDKAQAENGHRGVLIEVYGCVDYMFASSKVLHVTTATYALGEKSPDRPDALRFFRDKEDTVEPDKRGSAG